MNVGTKGISGWLLFPAYALLVACLLTVCDAFAHVHAGVLYYTDPAHRGFFPGQPTGDVFLGFLQLGFACVGLGWLLFRNELSVGLPRALLSAGLFVAIYFASGIFKESPMTIFCAFMALWVVQLYLFDDTLVRKLVAFSVLLGLAGPVWEGQGSASGFFAYYDQDAYYVPLWLSAMYFNGALAVAASFMVVESWRRARD